MDKQQIAQQILAKYKKTGYTPLEKQNVDLQNRFAELDAASKGIRPETKQLERNAAGLRITPSLIPQIKEAAQSGIEQAKAGYEQARTATNPLELVEGGTKLAAGAINTAFSPLAPVTAPIGEVVNVVSDKLSNRPDFQALAVTPQGERIMRGAEDIANISTIAGAVAGGKTAKGVELKPIDTVGIPSKKTMSATTKRIAAEKAAKATAEVDNLAGQIIQGKTEDIATAKKALSNIDTTGIKTYSDLANTLEGKITNISNKLDQTLESSPVHGTPLRLADLETSIKVGDKQIRHNYVQDSIQQLKDHYNAINDVVSLEKINQFENKANTQGVTIKEINDLAKEHGQTLNAFNANGQAASGLTKQAAENTRSGLKTTARDIFGNKLYNAADSELSALIKTKDLVVKMEEAVNKLQQKIKPRTTGEKLGRMVSQVVNILGANAPKGAVEYFLGRGTGLKTLNALDLEAALSKNLKNLQGALKTGATEADIISSLQKIIDENQSSVSSQSPKEGKILLKKKTVPAKTQQPIKNSNISK